MSDFDGMLLTRKGKNLMAKAQTGIKLNFLKVILGDGSLPENQDIEALETVINHKMDVDIHSITVIGDGTSQVRAVLINTGLAEGFFVREIGLVAMDPDDGEILYAYANAGDTADFIPSGGGKTVVENQLDLIAIVGNAENITAEVGLVSIALMDDIQDHNEGPLAHGGKLKAVPLVFELMRMYSSKYAEFELFVPSWTKLFDMDNRVVSGVAGSDVIVVNKTTDFIIGESYVIFAPGTTSRESIMISAIIDATHIRVSSNLANSFTGAEVRRTNWTVSPGQALAVDGGVYYASDLFLLNNAVDKGLIIRRKDNDAVLSVFFKDAIHDTWTLVPWSWKRTQGNEVIDVEYIVPARGLFSVKITSTMGASAVDPEIDCIVYLESESGLGGEHSPPLTPTIVSPGNGDTDVGGSPSLTTSAYTSPVSAALLGSQFQISSTVDFIVEDIIHDSFTVPGISYALTRGILDVSTAYFVRGRHIDKNGGMSAWTPIIGFTTAAVFATVTKPAGVAPGNGDELGSPHSLTLISSAFETEGGTDTHANSQWQISENPSFAPTINDSGTDASNLTSYDVPDDLLERGKIYYWRVRHEGAAEGWSDWSNSMMFSVASFATFLTNVSCAAEVYYNGVARDANGYIIAAGNETATDASGNALLTKFDSDGAILWETSLGVAGVMDEFKAVAVDATHIYAVGREKGGGNFNGILARFSLSDGALDWQRSLGGANSDYFDSVDVTATAVYAVGQEMSSIGTYARALIAKYLVDGTFVSQKALDGINDSYFYGVKCDPSGNVIAVGQANISSGVWSPVVVKFDSDLNIIWQRSLDGLQEAYFASVDIDSNGDILMGGGAVLGGMRSILLAKATGAGEFVWQTGLGLSSVNSYGKGIAVDSDGNVYCVGSKSSTYSAGFVVKFNRIGVLVWQIEARATGGALYFKDIAVSPVPKERDGVYVVGDIFASYDGTILSVNEDASGADGVIPDLPNYSLGEAYLAARTSAGTWNTIALPLRIPTLTNSTPSLLTAAPLLAETVGGY